MQEGILCLTKFVTQSIVKVLVDLERLKSSYAPCILIASRRGFHIAKNNFLIYNVDTCLENIRIFFFSQKHRSLTPCGVFLFPLDVNVTKIFQSVKRLPWGIALKAIFMYDMNS